MANVVNIVELQNTVTSVSGAGGLTQVQADLANVQKMVNFNSKTVFTDNIARYSKTPINVKDPMSFMSSIYVTGAVVLNGSATSGSGGTTGPTGASGAPIQSLPGYTGSMVITDPANTTVVYYTNLVQIPNPSTLQVAAHLSPASTLTYDIGSPSSQWRDIYLSTGTIHMGPTGKISYDNGAIVVSPALQTSDIRLTNGSSTIKLYTDGNTLLVNNNGQTGYVGGPTGPTGAVAVVSIVFDGGNAFITYPQGPAFDCGSST